MRKRPRTRPSAASSPRSPRASLVWSSSSRPRSSCSAKLRRARTARSGSRSSRWSCAPRWNAAFRSRPRSRRLSSSPKILPRSLRWKRVPQPGCPVPPRSRKTCRSSRPPCSRRRARPGARPASWNGCRRARSGWSASARSRKRPGTSPRPWSRAPSSRPRAATLPGRSPISSGCRSRCGRRPPAGLRLPRRASPQSMPRRRWRRMRSTRSPGRPNEASRAMIRVVVFLGLVCLVALGIVWLADRPGEVAITWLGWRIESSVLVLLAAVALLGALFLLLFAFARGLWRSPRRVARALREQRAGDRAGAETAFREMAQHADTRLLGLRGLYVEAQRRDDFGAARHFAEAAAKTAPGLPWAGQAVLEFRCRAADWEGALEILDAHLRNGLIDKATHRRHTAVLTTARALAAEATDPGVAKTLALDAARDPAWTADGVVSEHWLPVSPVTGRIDAFEWKVPLAELPGPGVAEPAREAMIEAAPT